MRRHTGQRALYEAWSLSRSKPKRRGLLERLRPQLQKLQAVANTALKAAATPRSENAEVAEAKHAPPMPPSHGAVPVRATDHSPLHDAETPKMDVLAAPGRREESPSTGFKVKTPKVGAKKPSVPKVQPASHKESVPVGVNDHLPLREADTPKVEVQKIEPPVLEAAKVVIEPAPVPAVESPKIDAAKLLVPELPAEEARLGPMPIPAVGTTRVSPVLSPKPIDRPISSPQVTPARANDNSPLRRMGDRLRNFRDQRNAQAGLTKDTKPHSITSLRPRAVQINAGRVEVSLPVKYAIAVVLVAIVVLIVAFRLGQLRSSHSAVSGPSGGGQMIVHEKSPVAPAPASQGNNMIVIVQHADDRQLEPLKEYFKANGIDTLIVSFARLRQHFKDHNLNVNAAPKGDGYLLLAYSNPLYSNPDTPGTDGYKVKQKIKDLGPKYKPEPGFASFSAESFSSTYGLKMQ
jgi:hypothetical protein